MNGPTTPRPDLELFAPESVAQQRARLDAERRRALMQARAAAPLQGRPVDATGDLFDRGHADAPLFAPPVPKGGVK